jgi:single-stranded DNA-specific DHH superfamily exonuclease
MALSSKKDLNTKTSLSITNNELPIIAKTKDEENEEDEDDLDEEDEDFEEQLLVSQIEDSLIKRKLTGRSVWKLCSAELEVIEKLL